MKQFLYGVQLEDKTSQSIFDLMRFIADPYSQRKPETHITLQGPYIEEKKEAISNLTSYVGRIDTLELYKTRKGSALVFSVFIDNVEKVWDKPSFPNGKPHITIFEGDSQEAEKLFSEIENVSKSLIGWEVRITKIKLINRKFMLAKEFPNYSEIKRIYNIITRRSWIGPNNIRHENVEITKRIRNIKSLFSFIEKSKGVKKTISKKGCHLKINRERHKKEYLPLFDTNRFRP